MRFMEWVERAMKAQQEVDEILAAEEQVRKRLNDEAKWDDCPVCAERRRKERERVRRYRSRKKDRS